MKRRPLVLKGAAALGSALLLAAHTPYGQWVTYRRRFLLIGCHRKDLEGYRLAKALESHLADHLPSARARVARAPDPRRLASLVTTDQIEILLLDADTATAMAAGRDGFEPYGAAPLSLLVGIDDRYLFADRDFPPEHAFMLTEALSDSALVRLDVAAKPWPLHDGARAFLEGKPMPAPAPPAADPPD